MPATSKKRSSGRRSRTTTRRQTTSRSGKDAISLLKQDHEKVMQLFKRFEKNPSEELLDQIENEIKVHTQIEEEIFYPAFREAVESSKDEHLYYEAVEEHHVVDLVLPEIKATSEGSDEFEAKGKVLKDLIEHHAKEEEEKIMFPRARKAMGMAQLREIGEQLQQRKQELMGVTGARATGAFERMLKPITGGRGGRNRGRAA